jgi:hypothetical protein
MKKLVIAGVIFMALSFQMMAQVDHDYNPKDVMPATGVVIPSSQVPQSVLQAMKVDFNLADPQTWTKFPYAIKEYGWVYDADATGVKPDRYEVSMKTDNGSDLFAVYSNDGNLIATREVLMNKPLPESIKEKLAKSAYKDWAVVGDKEIIKYYYDKNSVDQHFRITVEKNNVKRTISFNYEAKAAIKK